MLMTTKQWTVISILIGLILGFLGLGFAAMSTNAPFMIPTWVPYLFFALAFLVFIALVSYLSHIWYKNKHARPRKSETAIIDRNENLTDTLTRMHRRLVELQDEKFSHTKPSYGQIEKALPMLADRMGAVKIEDWPRYLRNLKSRIRRASPHRPISRGSIRQRATEWVKWRERVRLATVSVAKEAKAELLQSKKWAWKDGVKISDWIDEHHWGVQDIRDADQQWKADFESISHYLKQDTRLRELITEHIEMSRFYNDACLINRYSQRLPKTSFLITLHEALVGSPISPVNAEIYLSEISAEIDEQMNVLNQTEKELVAPSILIVDGLPQCRWHGNRLGRSWRLPVKNTSSSEAEDCRGKLIAIASTIQGIDEGLNLWPVQEYLNWSTGTESVEIAPNDMMELEIVNYKGYGSPFYLAYTKGEDFRKQHALKNFDRPILLVIGITSKSRPPVYGICKFHFTRLKHVDSQIIENDDNLEIIETTLERPDIRLYQQQDFHNGDSQI